MLSTGIRFGEGFDRHTLSKLIEAGQMQFEYDFLVVGSNAGGLAAAKEASSAGKKIALVYYREKTPAERERSDAVERRGTREADAGSSHEYTAEIEPSLKKLQLGTTNDRVDDILSGPRSDEREERLHRGSNYELPNILDKWNRTLKMGHLDLRLALVDCCYIGLKLLHSAAALKEVLHSARSCGWGGSEGKDSMICNWAKLRDRILDRIAFENFKLLEEMREDRTNIIFGNFSFIDEKSVRVTQEEEGGGGGDQSIEAETLCLALEGEHRIPVEIPGATQYGILPRDLIQKERPPGKTLVVGVTSEAVEWAGALSDLKYPVVLMCKSTVLKSLDKEMSQMIVDSMEKMGMTVLTDATLQSVQLSNNKERLVVEYSVLEPDQNEHMEESTGLEEVAEEKRYSQQNKQEEFDTLLFVQGKKVHMSGINIEKTGFEVDSATGKLNAKQETTGVPVICAVGEAVSGFRGHRGAVELSGRLLGRRLFHGETVEIEMNDVMPLAIFTPVEYAFIGCTEDYAISRLGASFIRVHKGNFLPLEVALTERQHFYMKIIVHKKTDLVLGIHVFGRHASEIIQGFAVAVKCLVTMTQLQTTVGVCMTQAEQLTKVSASNGTEALSDEESRSGPT